MELHRTCGILCHPTSLPGAFGIGDMGSGAELFIRFLVEAGASVWQVLPLGPTGYGDSPYQPFSAFAGNPLLISPERLVAEELLAADDLQWGGNLLADTVDYGQVIQFKDQIFRRSFERFQRLSSNLIVLEVYRTENRSWLDDYALFMALKQHFRWAMWTDWPIDIALRVPEALDRRRCELESEILYQCYLQMQFAKQWTHIRRLAQSSHITLIGDMPIFVGQDSADVWAHRELFQLDEVGRPRVVAGVPPDYFSPTGQLWGNPLYDWRALQATGYSWWLQRLQRSLSLVDQVRLDHFRGFCGYWEVPAGDDTAVNGRWVKGPGGTFFGAVKAALGQLPIIAEDLGLISADVIELRQELGLPGMRVLQFAFDSNAANEHLPHNWVNNLVVYTGTHDNDTSVGWYAHLAQATRERVRIYTGSTESDINWGLIRLALNSVADLAIVPLQDVLGLGSDCRLNSPGRPFGNWGWRYRSEMLRPELAARLKQLATLSGRYVDPTYKQPENKPVELAYHEL
ncbi:MAG: 4-alpha-glucanotransferase [Anaerolineae bacterium]